MIKKITLVSWLLSGAAAAGAQDMQGFRTDNYNGVSGAFFNPANLGDSRHKVDINLIGLQLLAGNNNLDFNLGKLSDLTGSDSGFVNKLMGNGQSGTVMAGLALHMPSISCRINDKTTVALLTRTRALFSITDFDGTLLNAITEELDNSGPYQVRNSTNMRMNINAFSEFGLSGGRVLYNRGNHFLKVGATLKYLAGIGNAYFQLNNLKGTIHADMHGKDNYITDASGRIALGVGGIDINNLSDVGLSYKAAGFGLDLGAVYEFRPDFMSGQANPYLLKFSAALLDLGSIRYTQVTENSTGAYDIHIPAGQRFALDQLNAGSVEDIKDIMDRNPAYFSPVAGAADKNYKVSLPTTIQLGADYHAWKGFYVSAFWQIAASSNESKAYNPRYAGSFTLTPRYESRLFAAYLPISYNSISKTNIGLGLRAGPFYAGSASIVNGLVAKAKQADFYFGFRAGIGSRSGKKSAAE